MGERATSHGKLPNYWLADGDKHKTHPHSSLLLDTAGLYAQISNPPRIGMRDDFLMLT